MTDLKPKPTDDVDSLSTLQRMALGLQLRSPDVDGTLEAIARIAVEAIDAAEHGSISLMTRGQFAQRAATSDPARVLCEWERRTQTGPCTDTASKQVVLHVLDSANEDRWEGFLDVAQQVGVRSMLCIPLWVEEQQLGSLTLYASTPDAFSALDERLAGVFATYAALALADARRSENLQTALVNRDVIGQGKGILMERHRVTADRAFELLSEASQRLNRKLSVVAEYLVSTGELP